ncbi:MAG TPA: helix-turn-helix transcriptional regulator, partial [Bryobacteraceae bacterium]|nr:helix-turn-helix transcriptional regulator [Bryobacteraceae bacterium]
MSKRTYLSQTELMIMLAIMRLGRNGYGIPIAQEIAARTGRELAIGVVYSTLWRLEDDALVRSEVGESTAARGGRAKT